MAGLYSKTKRFYDRPVPVPTHDRRLFLFLVILILPSVAIIAQGRKIAVQEHGRLAEER